MMKAIDLCRRLPADDRAQDRDMLRGAFECDLVEHVFDLCTDDDLKKKTMEELVADFVKALGGSDGQTIQQPNKNGATSSSNIFDATAGDAVQQVLGKIGIEVGAIVQMKPDPKKCSPFTLEIQFIVSHVSDDGSIGVRSIEVNGEPSGPPKIVKMSDIVQYNVIKKEQLPNILLYWDTSHTKNENQNHIHIYAYIIVKKNNKTNK